MNLSDIEFTKMIKNTEINIDVLGIPDKYLSQSPWIIVQKGIYYIHILYTYTHTHTIHKVYIIIYISGREIDNDTVTELQKMNKYRTPHEKMKCIVDTWSLLFNMVKINTTDDVGPDVYLPIMVRNSSII